MEHLTKFMAEIREISTKLPHWRFAAIWVIAALFGVGIAAGGLAKLLEAVAAWLS